MDIQKITLNSILSLCESAISLDISKLSTGVVLWENGEYELYNIDVRDIDSEAEMRFQFKNDLKSLVQGKHFQLATVENAIGGKNFKTTRKLLALNSVLEELALEGVVSYTKFYKKENTSWKMWLRKCYKVQYAPTHKHEIREILKYLGFEHPCQDILDAMGMLVGVILEENSDIKKPVSSKTSLKQFKFLWFLDNEDFEYSSAKLPKERELKTIDLSKSFSREFMSYVYNDGGDNIYYMQVPTSLLGAYALKLKIPVELDEVVLVAFRK